MIIEKPYSMGLWYQNSPGKKFHKMLNIVGGKISTECGRFIDPNHRGANCAIEPSYEDRCSTCDLTIRKKPPRRISYCPWCHREAKADISGSYVRGWISFVQCSNDKCGARGPKKTTTCYSDGEFVIEDYAIDEWNNVVGK